MWNARVQVGKTYRRTPLFRSDISYLVFNPTWTVPPGIIAADILPAARQDPHAITRKGLRVFDAAGREVNPEAIDWSRFRSGHIPYTLRQDPGAVERAGSGQVHVSQPVCGVPARYAFAIVVRARRPRLQFRVRTRGTRLELAEIVLNDAERWNKDAIARVVASGERERHAEAQRFPCCLTYWTAWVDPQGADQFPSRHLRSGR